jgi:hypothetical protein
LLPALDINFFNRLLGTSNAGVIDQYVDASPGFDQLSPGNAHLLGIGYITHHRCLITEFSLKCCHGRGVYIHGQDGEAFR